VGQCPTWWSPYRTWVAPSVQCRKVWLTLTTWLSCSNAAKMRKPLKFAGVPETGKLISAASRPKFNILWGHVEEILLLSKFFFPIVDTCLSCEDVGRQSCAMVPRWWFFGDFLRPAFAARRVQHVSDLHPQIRTKATPCVAVWQTSNLRPLRLGKEKKKKEQTTGWKYIWSALLHWATIKTYIRHQEVQIKSIAWVISAWERHDIEKYPSLTKSISKRTSTARRSNSVSWDW